MVFGHVDVKMSNSQNHTMDDLTRTPVAAGGCAKVFIQRDYSEGTNVKFLTKFPQELEGRIDKVAFEHTVSTMNNFYAEAEKATSRAYCESCLACITAYIVYICMESHYEKCLKRLGRFVHEQNVNVYEPKGLLIVDPIERGLRVIEISILNEPAPIRS